MPTVHALAWGLSGERGDASGELAGRSDKARCSVGENSLRISQHGNPEGVEIELKLGERGWAHEW
jgi:hypothetical protein